MACSILSSCLIVWLIFFRSAEQLILTFFFNFLFIGPFFFVDISANSFLQYLLELLSSHSAVTASSFINPVNVCVLGGGHWSFLESSSKARLCVYRLGKGWARGCGACSLLQRCLVCHLTVDCRAAIPPLSKQSCYIFHSKNLRGHHCV